MNIRRIDSSQYVNRLMSRDYDMIVTGYPVTTSPGANCSTTSARRRPRPRLQQLHGAEESGRRYLIKGLVRANTQADMLRYAHALDRVLQWNYYWIPNYYPPGTSTVWWNRFGMPGASEQ
jgi:microcin C transport system substrate-binding protein